MRRFNSERQKKNKKGNRNLCHFDFDTQFCKWIWNLITFSFRDNYFSWIICDFTLSTISFNWNDNLWHKKLVRFINAPSLETPSFLRHKQVSLVQVQPNISSVRTSSREQRFVVHWTSALCASSCHLYPDCDVFVINLLTLKEYIIEHKQIARIFCCCRVRHIWIYLRQRQSLRAWMVSIFAV